ncbi:SDR family NAD(P)-dependent oxidoreductase [Azospirillum sp. B4]|uniref:SDR family NAD(P)-dependent oxidoreductase n=1 Tax=Azospirillum sp. B4 TaxID=95605 RepID=UPI00034A85D8|nr:SDR family oxidoreductase [Azospirillum sp. B4]
MTSAVPQLDRLFGLQGRTAVVTGAATGIGRATAQLFAAAGAHVAAVDINIDKAEEFAAEVRSQGGKAVAVQMDQGNPTAVSAAFARLDEELPRVDVLLNCAAIYPRCNFETVTPEFLDRMYAINFRGVFQCTQEAVKRMKANGGGSIINISSVTSLKAGIYDNVQYAMTKAALNALTQSIALEYAEHNIRVNAILPGGVATEAAAASVQVGDPLRGPFMQQGRVPLGSRSADPAEIASACLYLASGASSFVTGQLIAVDGGFLIS